MDKDIVKKVYELDKKLKKQQEEIETLKKYILNNTPEFKACDQSDKIVNGRDYYSDGGTMLL